MLIAFQATRKARIEARDGDAGTLRDIYFDRQIWLVRYLEAEIASWLPGQRLLLMPEAVERADWAEGGVALNLPRQTLKEGPKVREHEPLSRQMENDLVRHFGWKPGWQPGPAGVPDPVGLPRPSTPRLAEDMNLWGMKDMLGFKVTAKDGEAGYLEDFILDDQHWTVRYLVTDIGNRVTGRRVLLNPAWCESADFENRRLSVSATIVEVDDRPDFDPTAPINQEVEGTSYDYYGRAQHTGSTT